MDNFLVTAENFFYKFYKKDLPQIKIAFISGGKAIDCVDSQSDCDIVFVNEPRPIKRDLKVRVGDLIFSFLEDSAVEWNVHARIFAYYIDESKIIYSTPEGLNQLQYYKTHALEAVKEFCALNKGWVDDFLDSGVFRKELYHFVYCWEIITNNRETIDRQLLLEMKRGRANATLRDWLIKVKAWYDTVSNMEETYHEQI